MRVLEPAVAVVAAVALLCLSGCGRRDGDPLQGMAAEAASLPADRSSNSSRPECRAEENSRDTPCDTSFISLVASPENYSDLWIRVIAYYPGKPVKMMMLDPVRWDYGDYPSGVVIDDAAMSRLGDAGYYSVVARFEHNENVPLEWQGAYTQLGLLREMQHPFKRTPLSLRVAECSPTPCPVKYGDGVLPIVIDPKD